MSLLELESFVVVAQEEHVGRAAKRLRISQPPLSRRIRQLEEELGVPLFERRARGMQLLPAGEVLLAHATEILSRVDAARASVRAVAPSSGRARPTPTPAARRSS